jgi:hypothetical protein
MSSTAIINPAFIPAARKHRVWGPLLVAFAVEALILAVVVFWLVRHAPPPTANPLLAPLRLDLTRPPTLDAARTAPPVSAPPAAAEQAEPAPPEAASKPAPDLPRERTPAEAPSHKIMHPQTAPKTAALPLPDLSLLPRDDGAAAGAPQLARQGNNGQISQTSEFYRQLNVIFNAAARNLRASRGIETTGQAVIVVHYRDGKAWGAMLVRSSGFSAVDQNILDIISRIQTWPPPPPGYEGQEIMLPISGSIGNN